MQKVRIRFAYKQGFRRLWLLISVLWVALMFYASKDDPSYFTAEFFYCAVFPVIGLYFAGAVVVWLIEGFVTAGR